MINPDELKSGFDIEMLISPVIFEKLLGSMYDAEEIPHEIMMGKDNDGNDNIRMISRPIITFVRRQMPDKHKILSNGDTFCDLEVKFSIADNKKTKSSDCKIFCQIFVEPGYDNTGRFVNNLILRLRYLTIDIGFGILDPSNELLKVSPLKEMVENMEQSINTIYHTTVIPGQVQRMETRFFPSVEKTGFIGVFGVYVNLLLKEKPYPYDEMFYSRDRGDTLKAINFLPEGYDYAIAMQPELYEKTGLHLKNELFANVITKDGKTTCNYKTETEDYTLNCKSISVFPSSSLKSLFVVGRDLLIYMNFDLYVKAIDLKSDLTVKFVVNLQNVGDDLRLDFSLLDLDIDVGFLETLRSALSGGSVLSIINICLGPVGWFMMPFVYWGAFNLVGNGISELAGWFLSSKINQKEKEISNSINYLNNRITFFKKRMSPFYDTHYQVEIKWKEVTIDENGIFAGGTIENTQMDEPKSQYIVRQNNTYEEFVISGKTRDENKLVDGLIYRIPDYQNVFKQEKIYRPDPLKPDEFLLALNKIKEMIANNQLTLQVQLTPDKIKIRDNKIVAIGFHSGLVLSPHEAGSIQYIQRALIVMRYKLIRRKHKLIFYYRAEPDLSKRNNLRSLPHENLEL